MKAQMRKYRVKLYCFDIRPQGVKGTRSYWTHRGATCTCTIRARSKDVAWRRILHVFFNKFPQALKRRLTVGGAITLAR